MSSALSQLTSFPPERFVVETLSELKQETVQSRWSHVNVILRLAMLTGLQMQLEGTLNLLCDMTAEIVAFDKAMIFFWDDGQEEARLRLTRGFDETPHPLNTRPGGNLLNFWVAKYARPLLITKGHPQTDALLEEAGSAEAVAVPLFAGGRVTGSLQIFATDAGRFSPIDAQLLWMYAQVAENLLTRECANEGLIRFASTDHLTGLRTRGYFEQQLELELKRAERRRQQFALLMVDIDHFKRLNDSFGHHVGDQALRDVSALLIKDMREADTAARYGGEEFIIILPETSEAGARHVAQRLRKTVEETSFSLGAGVPAQHITVSIGVAVFYRDTRLKRDLIEFADAALYAAKRSGRNRVICYSEVAPANSDRH